jgi:signal transduction histidine kinase
MADLEQNYEDFISTVIRGFSQTMLASWDKLDDESKKKFIKIIEEQSNRLINLVENMLSVSKLQTSHVNIIYNELNIKNPIEQVISVVKSQYPNQIFKFNYQKNLPDVFVDKDRFQQVMTNLIENSAKYSVEDNFTNIDTRIKNNNVQIEISNKGITIEKDDCEKIFTKFARIDNPLTRKVQGSGLGLYITKNLVEKMNGKIFVNSIPDVKNPKISTISFIVEFPILNLEEQARLKCNQ